MADEAQVRVSLQIKKGSGFYQSNPTAYAQDVAGNGSHGPGKVVAATSYTVVDLSALTSPGFCWMQNLSSTLTVQVGLYLSWLSLFVPLDEIPPGKARLTYLSQFIGKDLDVTAGTGTADTNTARLALKGVGGACEVQVDVFDR